MKTMWKFLSGKKTIIAAIASQVLIWVQVKGGWHRLVSIHKIYVGGTTASAGIVIRRLR